MRRNGEVASAGRLRPYGHLGWGYRDRDEFDAAATAFLADGVAQGQWVEYVGEGGAAALERRLSRLPGGAQAIADGVAGVQPVETFYVYTPEGVVDPAATIRRRAAATGHAVERGFTGFRAIVDGTRAVRTEEQRDAFARFEHLIDRRMARNPVSALCAFDVGRIDGSAEELTCLHPLTGPRSPAFRLFAAPDGALVLAGDVDLGSRELFERAVRRLGPLLDDELVLDLGPATFVEHRALLFLDAWAADRGNRVRLRHADQVTARMIELLGLGNVELIADAPPHHRSPRGEE